MPGLMMAARAGNRMQARQTYRTINRMERRRAFMRDALTDCRVERDAAPFDHPSLPFPDGRVLAATGAAGSGACR